MSELLKSENYLIWLKKNTNISTLKQIQLAYELQAGTYESYFNNETIEMKNEMINNANVLKKYIIEILKKKNICNIFEGGIGEANMVRYLLNVLNDSEKSRIYIHGCDLSISRLNISKKYVNNNNNNLCCCDLMNLPYKDNTFDIVYTNSAIEPNKDKEEKILSELYRVANNFLILFEPSYEEANDRCKQKFEKHGYIKNLKKFIIKKKLNMIEIGLTSSTDYYCQCKYVIKKNELDHPNNEIIYVCPLFKEKLEKFEYDNKLFYKVNSINLLYFIIDDIPILLIENSLPFKKIDK